MLAVLLAAQSARPQQDTTIRTKVPLVVVSTSVSDSKGHPIAGLTADDFIVLDNNVPRQIHVDPVDADSAPIALVIAIQTTGFSDPAIKKMRKTAGVISQQVLGGNGEAAILAFDNEVRISQDFTRDPDQIAHAISGFKAVSSSDGAALIDAIDKARDMLAHRSGARRSCILLISESKDRGSQQNLVPVLTSLQKSDIIIYGLTYSAYATAFTTKASEYVRPAKAGSLLDVIAELAHQTTTDTVKALTTSSGGRDMSFQTLSKLEKDLFEVGNDLHARYLLSFTPAIAAAATFHKIQVTMRNQPGAIVHARLGYWSSPDTTQ